MLQYNRPRLQIESSASRTVAQAARKALAITVAISLTVSVTAASLPEPPFGANVFNPMNEALEMPYADIFEEAHRLEFSGPQVDAMDEYLDDAKDYCVEKFEDRADLLESSIDDAQDELKDRRDTITETERHDLHCRIQNLRILESQASMLAESAVPTAFDNKQAKLSLIEQWPDERARILHSIESGAYRDRRFGDPEDIGFRELEDDQAEDVEDGQEAIEQLRRSGLMPPRLENEAIQKYVADLARKVAINSDLQVPVKVEVLNAKEINAFALPGGFLFLQRGLLEETEDEAQLVGVLAHETAHAAARHGHKLMKRATIAGIIYQAAQVAAMVLTGGVAGIGTYYALQYGFYGLGLVLSLDLLGVSRDFELEADQLGVQYAWKAGYDPSGFVRFFDKMATTKGYVEGVSWFRTHPPFFKRMVQSQEEMMYLPEKENLITQTQAFQEMKRELEKAVAESAEEEEGRPSLLAPEEGCPAPDKLEYEEDAPVEALCGLPTRL